MKPNFNSKVNNKQVNKEQIDLSEWSFIEDVEEWFKWETENQSVAGWITDITDENFTTGTTKVCHMIIDFENDYRLDEYKQIKFAISVDLQKKLNKLDEAILSKYDQYKVYIKLLEIRPLTSDKTKTVKVFKVAVKPENMPLLSDSDFIEI